MTQKVINRKKLIILVFFLEFIYGSLILMTGYTQAGLSMVVFGDLHHGGALIYSLIGQAIGSVTAMICLKYILKYLNIRWVFLIGFLIGLVAVICISQFNHFSMLPIITKRCLLFFFLFLLGIGIAPIDPLSTTLIGAIYKGKSRSSLILYIASIYVIGASFIPLFASPFIISLGSSSFAEVQKFYYIAIALSCVGAILGLNVNYRHNLQSVSGKIIDVNLQTNSSNKKLWNRLIWMVLIMGSYVVIETTLNYVFKNIGTNKFVQQSELHATLAFGLYLLVQGIWLIVTATFLVKQFPLWMLIVFHGSLIYITFIFVIFGILKSDAGLFITAIVLGIGAASLWGMIFTLAMNIDNGRSTYIGIIMNITTSTMIIVTELSLGFVWGIGQNSSSQVLYYMPIIIGIIISIVMISSVLLYKWFNKKYVD